MKITGLQKMTLLDFPGRIACTVFLQGCNFRCPFCHNSDLLDSAADGEIPAEELLSFLKKRLGMLDGVCITGGEPTLQKDLPDLLRQIRELGYPVKLDTNGSNPTMLRSLVERGLVDYVAMDIKNSREKYGLTAGIPGLSMEKIEESMALLLEGCVDYEFRTTVVKELHEEQDFRDMAQWVLSLVPGKRAKRFFLQSYVDRESVLCRKFSAAGRDRMEAFLKSLNVCAEFSQIRGAE